MSEKTSQSNVLAGIGKVSAIVRSRGEYGYPVWDFKHNGIDATLEITRYSGEFAVCRVTIHAGPIFFGTQVMIDNDFLKEDIETHLSWAANYCWKKFRKAANEFKENGK